MPNLGSVTRGVLCVNHQHFHDNILHTTMQMAVQFLLFRSRDGGIWDCSFQLRCPDSDLHGSSASASCSSDFVVSDYATTVFAG
eukprot:512255-Amphidinium_carterae.1